MSGLPFILTPTGRARLINPENTGTSGLTISHIGVSASDAGVVGGVLQGEIKRLDTFAGQVVADDTIHVTIRDDSADVYSLRAFALYFEDGTLMGWHAQPAVILEKSAQAMLLMSGDIQFQNLDVTTLIFGDSNWTNPVATANVFGVLRLATNEAALSGVSQVDAVTPAGLLHVLNSRFGVGAPSAFVKGLLGMATAALFRAAIGLGSASLRNEGAGNGLDADLLDGQHGAYYRDWDNLTGKPATFTPTAHGHPWAEISGAPATATRWPAFDEVTGKPAAYPPSAHTHAAADITAGIFDIARIPDLEQSKVTGLTAALAALAPKASPQFSGNVGIGVAAGVPLDVLVGSSRLRFSEDASVATISATNAAASALSTLKFNATALTRQGNTVWDASNFNPASKANASHTHGWNEVNPPPRLGGVDGNCWLISDWNNATTTGWYMASGASNAPDADWWMGQVIVHNPEWVVQRVCKFAADSNIEFQRTRASGNWSGWSRVYSTQTALDGRYAVRADNVVFRDVSATRGNGTGAVFLGDASRYLFYSGTRYEMPGADLKIDGTLICSVMSATSSDARLKDDIEDLADCLDAVLKMRPRAWRWKATGEADFGWVAQEHRAVREEFVHVDEEPFEGGDPLLSVRYGKAEPYLVGAIHELVARLNEMGARVRELEARIAT